MQEHVRVRCLILTNILVIIVLLLVGHVIFLLTTCVHVIIHQIHIVQLIQNQFILFWIDNCRMLQTKCVIVLFFHLQMVADMLVGQERNVYHRRETRLEDVDVAFVIPLDTIDKVVRSEYTTILVKAVCPIYPCDLLSSYCSRLNKKMFRKISMYWIDICWFCFSFFVIYCYKCITYTGSSVG